MPERRYALWRTELWKHVEGPNVLEVGVGTGKNIPYYPRGMQITAIDLMPGMLEQAQKRAGVMSQTVNMRLGDVQALDFLDASFDKAVAKFFYCSKDALRSASNPARGRHTMSANNSKKQWQVSGGRKTT